MTELVEQRRTRWTCPFCPLLCDDLTLRRDDTAGAWTVEQGDCPHAARGLAGFSSQASTAGPAVEGRPCSLADAVAAAATLLRQSGQPLFGGLGTDVAGARALYRLACRTGAICDPARGDALMHTIRTQQDRGGFATTLAEVRTRADVIVCLSGVLGTQGASLLGRCGIGEPMADEPLIEARHLVLLGATPADAAVWHDLPAHDGIGAQSIPLAGDLFDDLAGLAAAVRGHPPRDASASLTELADRLRQARYAVFIGDSGSLPPQGSLIVETVNQIVATLNQRTRAASLWIGTAGGTANEVFTWLSGLPLRSRAGPRGLEHEPVCFDASRLLADGAVDALLWISAIDANGTPPETTVPTIVIGHPALAASQPSVFIPVSTPGIGSSGHLFRTDGGVVLPLAPLYRDELPTVAEVIHMIDVRSAP